LYCQNLDFNFFWVLGQNLENTPSLYTSKNNNNNKIKIPKKTKKILFQTFFSNKFVFPFFTTNKNN